MHTIPGAVRVANTTQDALNVIRNAYQDKIFDDVRRSRLMGNRRILIQSPPASGKSFVFIRFAKAALNKNKTIFYVAPRINLVLDIHKKIQKTGIRVGLKMSNCPKDMFARVQLCCTPSLLNECKGEYGAPHADILVLDESHVEQESIVELVAFYPKATIISMSGTPLPGQDRFVDDIVKGPTVSFLMKHGLLPPIKYIEAGKDKSRPAEIRGRKSHKLIGEVVSTWLNNAKGLPTVLFASSVAASRELCRRFMNSNVPADHMDAGTPNDERERMFAGLKDGSIHVLCTVETFSYGVDVECVSCAILAYTVEKRLKNTPEALAAYVQKVSRIIRTFEGKRLAIVIDHVGLKLEFGPIERDHDWFISSADGEQKLEEEIEKIKRMVECGVCGEEFCQTDHECPRCGTTVPRRNRGHVKHIEAQLGVVGPDGEISMALPTGQERRRFYEDSLRWCQERGWQKGKAYYLFKKRFPGYATPRIWQVTGVEILPANRALLSSYAVNEAKAYHAKRCGTERHRSAKEGVASSSERAG